jgi:hypothetical protein
LKLVVRGVGGFILTGTGAGSIVSGDGVVDVATGVANVGKVGEGDGDDAGGDGDGDGVGVAKLLPLPLLILLLIVLMVEESLAEVTSVLNDDDDDDEDEEDDAVVDTAVAESVDVDDNDVDDDVELFVELMAAARSFASPPGNHRHAKILST